MIPVLNQWASALIMLYGGLAFGLVYRVFRSLCYGSFSRLRLHLTDSLIVISFFLSLGLSLLYATFGSIRLYALVFYACGFFISQAAFGPLFTFILKKIHKK